LGFIAPTEPTTLTLADGKVLNIETTLGKGGTSIVYKCSHTDDKFNIKYAVKKKYSKYDR